MKIRENQQSVVKTHATSVIQWQFFSNATVFADFKGVFTSLTFVRLGKIQ
ncbi:MAG: hypothetical protein ACLPYZ_10190 [Limisphaerales bacterium]